MERRKIYDTLIWAGAFLFFIFVVGSMYLFNILPSSGEEPHQVAQKDFQQEEFSGFIAGVIKMGREGQKKVTVVTDDDQNWTFEICSDDALWHSGQRIVKQAGDKFVYLDGYPLDLYQLDCGK